MFSERSDRITGRTALTVVDYRFDKNPTYGNNQLPGAPPTTRVPRPATTRRATERRSAPEFRRASDPER